GTLHGLGALDGSEPKASAAAVAALKHKSAGVRRNAALVLPRTAEGADAILGGALNDPDPHVRLAALLALAEMPPHPKAGAAVAEMILRPENARDRWIADAATAAAARHDRYFLAAFAAGKAPQVQRSLDLLGTVAEHYARGKTEDLDAVLTSMGGADKSVADKSSA